MSASFIFLLCCVALPLIGSGFLTLVSPQELSEERHERTQFIVMALLPITGLMFFLVFLLQPVGPSTAFIPPLTEFYAQAFPAVAEEERTRIFSFAGTSVFALGVLAFGSILHLFRLAIQFRRLRSIVKEATANPEGILYTNRRISPFSWSDRTVVLPEELSRALSPSETECIVAHERAHIDRRDGRWFKTLAIAEAIFWYNPFVRAQATRCRLAAECAVDAKVLDNGPYTPHLYGKCLLKAAQMFARNAAPVPSFIARQQKGETRMRIERIFGHTNVSRRRAFRPMLIAFGTIAAALQITGASALSDSNGILSVVPTKGKVVSAFGPRPNPIREGNHHHRGVDIRASLGTPIKSPGAGIVREAGEQGRYGLLVRIDHSDSLTTRFAHMNEINVKVGDRVTAGQLIGTVGSTGESTGPHLHFEVISDGQHVDPETLLTLR